MTATVTIEANHVCPVEVTFLNPATGEGSEPGIVAHGTVQKFYVHDGQDLFIHEVQPAERQVLRYYTDDELRAELDRRADA